MARIARAFEVERLPPAGVGRGTPVRMVRFVGVQSPLPEAGGAIDHSHCAARSEVLPCFVPLPPARAAAGAADVFIGRLTVGHGLDRQVAPHVGDALGDVLTIVTGLAPLKVEPVLALVRAVQRVWRIVNADRLTARPSAPHLHEASQELPDSELISHISGANGLCGGRGQLVARLFAVNCAGQDNLAVSHLNDEFARIDGCHRSGGVMHDFA
jgi:hypothetical protein